MNRRWVAIQRNPISGTGTRRGQILELVSGLRQRGFRPRIYKNRQRLMERLADPRQREELVCIVAAGGDGTVGDIINRFPGLPVAILPLGTENLLARYLKIPSSGKAVAEMIATGETRRLDLGEVSGRRFAVMASFGFDADVVRRTDARRTGPIRKLNYLQPIWESFRKYKYPELRIHIDQAATPLRACLLVAVNLPVYALRLPVAEAASGDDGLLDLKLFRRGSAFQMLRYFYKVAMGKHEALEDVQTVRTACFRVESDEPVPIQVDGDPAGWTPAEVRTLPAELEVFVPMNQTNV